HYIGKQQHRSGSGSSNSAWSLPFQIPACVAVRGWFGLLVDFVRPGTRYRLNLALAHSRRKMAAAPDAFTKFLALFRGHLLPALDHAPPPVPATVARPVETSPSAEQEPA